MDTKESVGQESEESLKETTVSAVEETVLVSEVEAVSSVSGTDHNNEATAMPTLPSGKPARVMCVRRVWKVIKTILIILLVGYVILGISRIPHVLEERKTNEVVAQIHATKLTMDDVMGTNLPPDPGAEADKTIAGVDVNKNGIRDDVELAIFNEYATSSKTRAVLLQYALALQMEFTQLVVNTGTVIAVAQEGGRAYSCVGHVLSRENLNEYVREGKILRKKVEDVQLNTPERKQWQEDFYNNHLRSYEAIRENICDIDLNTLSD